MNYKTEIKNYKWEIEITNDLIEQEYWHIGVQAWKDSNITTNLLNDNEEYKRIIDSCNELHKQKISFENRISNINQLEKQIEDIKQNTEGRKLSLQELQQEFQKLFETTGLKIFDFYTRTSPQYMQYNTTLTQLTDIFHKRDQLEQSIEKKSTKTLSFLKRMSNQANLHLLKNKIKKMQNKITELCYTLTKKIYEEWQIKPQEDEKLKRILSPISNQNKKIDEIQKIITKQEQKIQDLLKEQRNIIENYPSSKYVQYLRLQITEFEEELRLQLIKSGKILAKTAQYNHPEKITHSLTSIEKLFNENQQREKAIKELQVAENIELLEKEKKQIQKKIINTRLQITQFETQLEELNLKFEKLDNEIKLKKNHTKK